MVYVIKLILSIENITQFLIIRRLNKLKFMTHTEVCIHSSILKGLIRYEIRKRYALVLYLLNKLDVQSSAFANNYRDSPQSGSRSDNRLVTCPNDRSPDSPHYRKWTRLSREEGRARVVSLGPRTW